MIWKGHNQAVKQSPTFSNTMSMNIWYVNHYAGGPGIGKFVRAYHLGRAWAEEGHTTTVFVARWHHLLERPEPLPSETVIDGVRYVALDARPYKGNGLRRIFNMLDYCRSAGRLARREELSSPDAIIVSSPHPFGILPAWLLARQHGAKLVFEVRDLWPLSVVELNGTSRWHPFVLLCALVERFAYRRSHLVASLLGGAEAHMRARGLGPGKFVHLPNGIDPDRNLLAAPVSEPATKAARQIDQWHAENRIVLIHPGAQGLPNALDLLLDATSILNDKGHAERFGVLLVGEGPQTQALKQRAKELGLSNVAFFPVVPSDDALWLTMHSDIGYAGTRNVVSVYRHGISFNKLADFMQAGLPVILPVSVQGDPVSESGCGIVTGSDNPADVAQAILRLVETSSEDRAAMGRKGLEYAKRHLDYRRIARAYVDAIKAA